MSEKIFLERLPQKFGPLGIVGVSGPPQQQAKIKIAAKLKTAVSPVRMHEKQPRPDCFKGFSYRYSFARISFYRNDG